LFADKFGVLNIEVFVSLATAALIFAILGVTNVGSVVVFAILYGFFSGGGLLSLLLPHTLILITSTVLSLYTPVLASFIRDPSELG
jgi:hypothetical protein